LQLGKIWMTGRNTNLALMQVSVGRYLVGARGKHPPPKKIFLLIIISFHFNQTQLKAFINFNHQKT